jgi:hypothetical protein
MHTLHTKTAHIHNGWTKENAEHEVGSLWPEGWCPLLQGIARLCCDPRKTVSLRLTLHLASTPARAQSFEFRNIGKMGRYQLPSKSVTDARSAEIASQ